MTSAARVAPAHLPALRRLKVARVPHLHTCLKAHLPAWASTSHRAHEPNGSKCRTRGPVAVCCVCNRPVPLFSDEFDDNLLLSDCAIYSIACVVQALLLHGESPLSLVTNIMLAICAYRRLRAPDALLLLPHCSAPLSPLRMTTRVPRAWQRFMR